MNELNLLEQIHQRLPEIHHQILTQLEHQFTEVKDYRQGPEHRTILTIGCGHGADECPTHSKGKMREQ